MARIAGICGAISATEAAGYLDSMLRLVGRQPAASATSTNAALASTEASCGFYDNGRLCVALDGQIYNQAEFPPPHGSADAGADGDAARIAASFDRHGLTTTLERLNGDFAFALHDRQDRVTWLARDRFGIKPLYWSELGGHLAFASRSRSLFALPWVQPEPRREWVALFAVANYRFFDNAVEHSPYQGVRQLPAGRLLRCDPTGQITQERWYQPPRDDDLDDDLDTLAERYCALLEDAVRLRLARADRPAFTLSGGMDSSSVLTTAHHLIGRKLTAFSTVYSEDDALSDYNEAAEIQDVIDTGIADWIPVRIEKPDIFTAVAELVALHDEPVATVTWMTHHLLCREVVDRGFRTLLGGLGGDEQHAGEYDYFFYHFADLERAGKIQTRDHEVGEWARHHNHPIWVKDAAAATRGVALLTDPTRAGRNRANLTALHRYRDALEPDYFDLDGFEPVVEAPFRSHLKSHSWNELMRATMPCCLRASDRNTEAHGLTDIFPFFDHRLLEFSWRVPGHFKIHDGITKRLLRRAMQGRLPDATRNRIKKTGWNAPAHIWFSGAERDRVLDLVRSRSFGERGIYRADEVERLAEEHFRIVDEGRAEENHMMLLWQVVNLELWLRDIESLKVPHA